MYIATSSFDVMRRVPHAVNGMDMKCRGLRRVVSVRRLLDDDLLVNELNPHVAFPRQLSDPTTTAQRVYRCIRVCGRRVRTFHRLLECALCGDSGTFVAFLEGGHYRETQQAEIITHGRLKCSSISLCIAIWEGISDWRRIPR